jgi:hypothetical protein
MKYKSQEEVEKEFDKKFVTKSVFGISIGTINNLNQSTLEQVHSFIYNQRQEDLDAIKEIIKTALGEMQPIQTRGIKLKHIYPFLNKINK